MKPATTAWSDKFPTGYGTYLIEYIGDWFPEGNPNNLKHQLVYVVDGGVLSEGRFLEPSDYAGWKWAKVLPS